MANKYVKGQSTPTAQRHHSPEGLKFSNSEYQENSEKLKSGMVTCTSVHSIEDTETGALL